MALNIKNTEAHRMATELARMRGVSVTRAVTEAIRHELERENRRSGEQPLGEQLLQIGRRCAAHVSGPVSSGDHADLLYDREGLPR